ncbi:MAG TPA: peptide ABC transporter substrate-binding protein, partial [Clostridium sp.]|nr:peptide ABC transporter substrate-binding protein [Clostridium sp.]
MKKIIFTVICIIAILTGISIEREKINSVNDNNIDCITYNMNMNPNDLQLTATDSVRDKDLLVTLFEGLVKENENGEIVPALSKEVEISDDGLEYTFKLREDIYYSSGE